MAIPKWQKTAGAKPAQRGSLREAFYLFYREHPGTLIGRNEAAERFGVTLKSIDRVVKELRDDGLLVRIFGYAVAESVRELPVKDQSVAPPVRASRAKPKPELLPAEWPRRPVANSVFQLGQTL